jgi:K+-sensing histidine kinase KdpD
VSDDIRPTGEQALAKLQTAERARLRIYIGAAPGVGKTYSMIEDAHTFRREGVDVVIGFIETHGRAETEARLGDIPIVPRRRLDYRGVVLEEMDVDAIIARKPQLCLVDELAHTNAPGGRPEKRFVRVKADKPADGLVAFAKREGITHVIFGQSARTRWEIVWKGSTLNRFLEAVRDAAVQVVPLGDTGA